MIIKYYIGSKRLRKDVYTTNTAVKRLNRRRATSREIKRNTTFSILSLAHV